MLFPRRRAASHLPSCRFDILVAGHDTDKHTEKTSSHIPNFSYSSSVCPSICSLPGYQISYRLDSGDPQRWTTVEVGSNARQFTVTGLLPEQTYFFKLVSRTAVGWGEEKQALVVTTERRGKRTRPLAAANISHGAGRSLNATSPEMDPPPRSRERPAAFVLSTLLLRQKKKKSGSP